MITSTLSWKELHRHMIIDVQPLN